MKFLKLALLVVVLLMNWVMMPLAWADPIAEKSPEYAEITQSLTDLLQAQTHPEESGFTAAELQQKIATLQFQKYIMETSEDWGICRNETGANLGIYAHQPKHAVAGQPSTLFYLADGEATDDNWDCDGIYLPKDTNLSGTTLPEPVAFKIVDGMQLLVATNPETHAIELNLPLTTSFKAGETNWEIPDLLQADIDAQAANAPTD